MLSKRWMVDTITRRFALSILFSVISVYTMHATANYLFGDFTKPPLQEHGALGEIITISKMMNSVPAQSRPQLANSASNSNYAVSWYPAANALTMFTDSAERKRYASRKTEVRLLLGWSHAAILTHSPDPGAARRSPRANYDMGIELPDHSWVVFSTPTRFWGLDSPWRDMLIIGYMGLAGLIVAILAIRLMARPFERFSRAAERFGFDLQAPPIEVSGPLEFRTAAHVFNEMQARIQRFVTDRTEMLAAISHDLRAPLTRLRLRGEFIEDREQQRKLFRDVDEMQAMVNSAMSFFRDDVEHEAPTRFDISELVKTVVDDFRDAVKNVEYAGLPNQVYYGRPSGIRRAITNIVENAIKYGDRASITLTATAQELRLLVEDDGPGIPDALNEAVFRPFFRVESSRNRHTGGVGLGLSAARSIIRGHGGEITIANRPGKGLRVLIELPILSIDGSA